jgi:hypothetical protein
VSNVSLQKPILVVILTEGIVKDIVAGNPKIVQVYVDPPLLGIRQQMLLMFIADP